MLIICKKRKSLKKLIRENLRFKSAKISEKHQKSQSTKNLVSVNLFLSNLSITTNPIAAAMIIQVMLDKFNPLKNESMVSKNPREKIFIDTFCIPVDENIWSI